jgi:hypothetical protein
MATGACSSTWPRRRSTFRQAPLVSADLSKRLTSDHTAAGRRFIAAPVFGRPAAAGKLFVIAAGRKRPNPCPTSRCSCFSPRFIRLVPIQLAFNSASLTKIATARRVRSANAITRGCVRSGNLARCVAFKMRKGAASVFAACRLGIAPGILPS